MLGFTHLSDASGEPYKATLLIDINNLPSKSRAEIIRVLSSFTAADASPRYLVQPGDNLYNIIARKYRFSDGQYPQAAGALARQIVNTNKLKSRAAIKGGQVLTLPNLPARPLSKGASTDLTQELNFETSTVSLRDETSTDVVPLESESTLQLRDGATWKAQLTNSQLEELLAALPPEEKDAVLRDQVYVGPGREIGDVFTLENAAAVAGGTGPELAAPPNPAPVDSLSALTSERAGVYAVLDFFHVPVGCAHGILVLDKIRATLTQLGAAQLNANIMPIELDFFANRATALKEVQAYINSMGSTIRQALQPTYDWLKTLPAPSNGSSTSAAGKPVPLIYLQAVYGNRLHDPRTAVISSSFYVNYDGYQVLPNGYQADSAIPLVSAVLDDQGSKIEDVQIFEPLMTFRNEGKGLGLILVGAQSAPGMFLGMSSRTGDGVTAIANGSVTGTTGACATQTAVGTSFAAPVIATDLLVAKAIWASRSEKVSAREAKLRMLVSSDIDPAYVSLFASGGVPRIDKLLLPSGCYGIRADGTMTVLADAAGSSFVEVSTGAGLPDHFVFRHGDAGFSGIEIVGTHVFIFREATMKWESVQVARIHFNANGSAFDSIAAFGTQFQGALLL